MRSQKQSRPEDEGQDEGTKSGPGCVGACHVDSAIIGSFFDLSTTITPNKGKFRCTWKLE
jgi:hypothetical protein